MGTERPLGKMISKSASVGRLLSAGGGGCSYLNFNLVRLDTHLCPFRIPTAANACDQSLPCSNTKITCHSDSSINSQLISPVIVNPLLL